MALSVGRPSQERVEYRTLTSLEVTNKALVLSESPYDGTEVLVDIIGGCSQKNGIDFSVSETTLGWDGMGFSSLASADVTLRIRYQL